MMPTPARSRLAVAATGAAVSVALIAAGASSAGATTSHAAEHVIAFGGNAYGTRANLGSLLDVGRTNVAPMCTTKAGTHHSNKTAKVDLTAAIGSVGAVTADTHAIRRGATSTSTTTTHTADTTLLAGMVRLQAVTTRASVSHGPKGYRTSGGSVFVGLTVAGKSMPASVPANSSYTLPGIGTLTLNAQQAKVVRGVHEKINTALQIVIGKNATGLPAGTITVGHSVATLRSLHRVPSAAAYATQLSVSSLAGSGRTAAAYSTCGGTGTNTNNLVGLKLPQGVATVQTAKSVVTTADSASKSSAIGRNDLAGVSLFNGTIRVSALTTRAEVVRAGSKRTRTANGTTIGSLIIQGKKQSAPRMGQRRSIPGLGTLTFGYATKSRTGIQVYGLRIVLGTARGNLPAGAVITVGSAQASIAG